MLKINTLLINSIFGQNAYANILLCVNKLTFFMSNIKWNTTQTILSVMSNSNRTLYYIQHQTELVLFNTELNSN